MASNVVIDATSLSSFQSDVASLKQNMEMAQYYYIDKNGSQSAVPLIPSDINNSISVFQAAIKFTVGASPTPVTGIAMPNPFKNYPIVSAIVQCENAPGYMVPVITRLDKTSVDFLVYVGGMNTNASYDATLHVTAISYQ